MSDDANATTEVEPPAHPDAISWPEFFETVPPGGTATIRDYANLEYGQELFPAVTLHCEHAVCGGPRYFFTSKYLPRKGSDLETMYAQFTCRNCRSTQKLYAFVFRGIGDDGVFALATKIGENPGFGPPTPARLQRLVQADRDLLLKGRRCENQGLGVGAFTYYRRVVEDSKNRFIDEIIRVSQHVGAPAEMIESLSRARDQVQFSQAVEQVKDAIPPQLLINGHNPLTLLHRALSKGVHELSDERCLELATDIRLVLTEFSERLGQALKDEAELKNAVSRLLRP